MQDITKALTTFFAGLGGWQSYVAAVTSLGVLTMAFIEAIKNLTPVRRWFRRARLENWLNDYAKIAAANLGVKVDLQKAEAQLLLLATDEDGGAFFDLEIEKMMAQWNAVQIAQDFPKGYIDLCACVAARSKREDFEVVLDGTFPAPLPPQIAAALTPDQLLARMTSQQSFVDARTRVAHRIQRALDSFQISTSFRWKWSLQLASFLVSFGSHGRRPTHSTRRSRMRLRWSPPRSPHFLRPSPAISWQHYKRHESNDSWRHSGSIQSTSARAMWLAASCRPPNVSASVDGRSRIYLLIHGYNNDFSAASNAYESFVGLTGLPQAPTFGVVWPSDTNLKVISTISYPIQIEPAVLPATAAMDARIRTAFAPLITNEDFSVWTETTRRQISGIENLIEENASKLVESPLIDLLRNMTETNPTEGDSLKQVLNLYTDTLRSGRRCSNRLVQSGSGLIFEYVNASPAMQPVPLHLSVKLRLPIQEQQGISAANIAATMYYASQLQATSDSRAMQRPALAGFLPYQNELAILTIGAGDYACEADSFPQRKRRQSSVSSQLGGSDGADQSIRSLAICRHHVRRRSLFSQELKSEINAPSSKARNATGMRSRPKTVLASQTCGSKLWNK